MKNIIVLLSFIVLGFAHNISKSFAVEGMHCDYGCVQKIKTVVASLDGVQSCDVDFRQKKMTVVYNDDKLDSESIVASLDQNTTFITTEIKEKKKSFWSRFKGLFNG